MVITTIEDRHRFYEGKKVLITGYNGFKGTWLSLWLKQMKAEVYGIGLTPGALATEIKLDKLIDGHYTVDIGFEELNNIFAEVRPDVVFHLAAQPLVLKSYLDPIETYRTNVMGTMNVIQACRNAGVKHAVFITTDKCYENDESGVPIRETDRFGGSDPYSSSKGCCEILIDSMRRSYPECRGYFSARAGNVIGGGDWADNRIVPDFFRAFQAGAELELRNPKSTRPWQHVLEPLYGYLLLGMRDDEVGFGVNFGPYPNKLYSVFDVIQRLKDSCKAFDEKCSVPNIKYPEIDNCNKEAKLLQLDITRAINEIGWSPVLSFEKTIEMTAHWYLKSIADKNKNDLENCLWDIAVYEARIFLDGK